MFQKSVRDKGHQMLIIILMVFSFLVFLFIPYSLHSGQLKGYPSSHTAVFPSQLQHVGEEAFEETSFSTIIFKNELLTIGNKAFYANQGLYEVFLPPSLTYLADTAFDLSALGRIHGTFGSLAHQWAEEHDVQFLGDYTCCTAPILSLFRIGLLFILLGVIPPMESKYRLEYKARTYIPSMRPQDRTELYPINYRFP